MKLLFILISLSVIQIFPQLPDTIWTKVYGGDFNEIGYCVSQNHDSGYIVAGVINLPGTGDDIILIRTDKHGDTLWVRTFGGYNSENVFALKVTNDRGFIIAGSTNSFGSGTEDFLILKTDHQGNTQWLKTYGSANSHNAAYDVIQTSDSGYIIIGDSVAVNITKTLIIKLDFNGNIIWEKSLLKQPAPSCIGRSIQKGIDNGFYIGGFVKWFIYPYTWKYNYFLAKISEDGEIYWWKQFENSGFDIGKFIEFTSDGNIVIAGNSGSTAYSYVWLVKVNSNNGGLIWNKKVHTSQPSVQLTSFKSIEDEGFIFTQMSTQGTASIPDVQLIKLDKNGDIKWEKMLGGPYKDVAFSVSQTIDKGYIVVGQTEILPGNSDVWLLYFKTVNENITVISPNGGEVIMNGDTVLVKWVSEGVENLKIQLSTDNAASWKNIVDSIYNTGSYLWNVQSSVNSNECIIRVISLADSSIKDDSDSLFSIQAITQIKEEIENNTFQLHQNYPNPFNPSTKIKYSIPQSSKVTLKVYDVLGKEAAVLVNEEKAAGEYEVELYARNFTSGVYFYQLIAGSFIQTNKMILMR